MRSTLIVVTLLSLAAAPTGFAQIKSDPGTIGARAIPRAPDSNNPDAAANSSIPSGQARRDRSGSVPAIPANEARATIESRCGGPVSDFGMDDHATWHAKCHKDGQTQAVTLGPDGNVQIR